MTMRFPRLLVALILALFCASFSVVDVDAAKGSGRSAKSGTSKPKTVHVKEYTKKDGTKVKAHDRSARATKAAKPAKTKATKPPKTPAVVAVRDENGRIKRSEAARHAFEVQTG